MISTIIGKVNYLVLGLSYNSFLLFLNHDDTGVDNYYACANADIDVDAHFLSKLNSLFILTLSKCLYLLFPSIYFDKIIFSIFLLTPPLQNLQASNVFSLS